MLTLDCNSAIMPSADISSVDSMTGLYLQQCQLHYIYTTNRQKGCWKPEPVGWVDWQHLSWIGALKFPEKYIIWQVVCWLNTKSSASDM